MSEDNDLIENYQTARLACEMAKDVLAQYDFRKLLDDIAKADSIGAMVDPTLYRSKRQAMQEDREVFEAALRFIRTWEKKRD